MKSMKTDFESGLGEPTPEAEELSMPTRIGRPKAQSMNEARLRESLGIDEDYRSLLSACEEANLTEEDRSTWKAKYDDLTTRRKGFQGAATYAYGGVFSWSMYSTAEAKDEAGVIYTEYLMRCQWGPDWDTMQPWIVARRFREFVNLDSDIRQIVHAPESTYKFASSAGSRSSVGKANANATPAVRSSVALPELPTRFLTLFGGDNMDAATIQDRKEKLEHYMVILMNHYPTALKSVCVDRFFGISDRIRAIRKKLVDAGEESAEVGRDINTSVVSDDYGEEGGTQLEDFSYGKGTEDIASGKVIAPGSVAELKKDGEDEEMKGPSFTTLEQATALVQALLSSEQASEELANDRTLFTAPDGVELGKLEEKILEVAAMQRNLGTKKYLLCAEVQGILAELSHKWPNVKAAAVISDEGVGKGVDPSLLTRAMQIDEDLTLLTDNYRGIHKALMVATERARSTSSSD